MQRLQPYYVLDSVCDLAHHFRVTYDTNMQCHMTWNGTELTELETRELSPAMVSRIHTSLYTVPLKLQHVRYRIVQHIGTERGVHVHYEGYFTLYTVTKLVALLIQGKLRLARYTAKIEITPDSRYHMRGMIRSVVTIPKRAPPPREVLNHYSTIDKSAVRKIVQVDGTPDWDALNRVCSYGKELSPALLSAIQRPTVPITYFNTMHTLRVDVPLERFQQ